MHFLVAAAAAVAATAFQPSLPLPRAAPPRRRALHRAAAVPVATSFSGSAADVDAALAAAAAGPPSAREWQRVATGTWTVAHAPHIDTLSKLFGVTFSPIEYLFLPDRGLRSHVRYHGWPGDGWLSTAGSWTEAGDDVRVTWDHAWFEPGAVAPSSERPAGAVADAVDALGKVAFVEAVSVFPVDYVDDEACVFRFPALGTRIGAVRSSSSSSAVRGSSTALRATPTDDDGEGGPKNVVEYLAPDALGVLVAAAAAAAAFNFLVNG